jgi:broad specificity phosphatase PhoE
MLMIGLVVSLTLTSTVSLADCGGIKLLIMRHGDGEHILEGVRNSTNHPLKHLTREGVRQTHQAAQDLKLSKEDFAEVISSPLQRTLETAAVFYHSLPVDKSHSKDKSQIDQSEFPVDEIIRKTLRKVNKELTPTSVGHCDVGSPAAAQSHVCAESNSEDKKLTQNEKQKLASLVSATPLHAQEDLLERNFGLCEGTRLLGRDSQEDCYNQADQYGKLKKLSAEGDAKIVERATRFLNNMTKKYCELPYQGSAKYILVSTHDVTAKKMIEAMTGETVELAPASSKILDLEVFYKKTRNPAPGEQR